MSLKTISSKIELNYSAPLKLRPYSAIQICLLLLLLFLIIIIIIIVKSNLTAWCEQISSNRDLNALT